MLFKILIVLIFLINNSPSAFKLVDSNDDSVISWNFGSYIRPKNSSVEFDLNFFSPTKPGKYPIIVFLTGLDGLAGGFLYHDFSKKLVHETNAILVCFDTVKPPKLPDKEEKLFAKTLNWALENMNGLFDSKNTPFVIKNKVYPIANDVALMGHSASGHTVVSYLNETCGSIKSLILLDPVDGFDPFGLIKIFITNPPKQLPFVIPTLHIETEYDPVSRSGKIPACAPANVSNSRFYDSLAGPTWSLNFTNYGHADILDDWAIKYVGSTICKTCENNCDYSMYRTNVVKAIGLFYNGINQKNSQFVNALEEPNSSGFFDKSLNVLSKYKYNGYNIL
ncbi:unnamed protein product, partial [Brachionus calyciflorus]